MSELIDQLNALAQWIETRRSRDIDRDVAVIDNGSLPTGDTDP